ncbi:MAG: OmpA family protein [Bdellovibrionales bacterium]|nr:OmpA family protein [Bdellovibrionales bacterium]
MKNIIALALILVSTSAFADIELGNRFGIGVAGGLSIPTGASAFKNASNSGYSLSIAYQYFFTNQWGIALTYDRAKFGSNMETLGESFNIDGLYRFCATSRLSPVLGLGIGTGNTSGSLASAFNAGSVAANARLGIDYALTNDWVLGLTAKYLFFFNEHGGNLNEQALLPQLQITYYFEPRGSEKKHEEPKAAAPAVKVDSDHDGAFDDEDKCPNTPAGTKVNSLGCPVDQKVEFKINIEFDTGKSVVKPEYNDELQKMADLLKAHPDMGGEIQGHTDSTGKESTNMKVSDARAKAVKKYLADKLGVKWDTLTGKGYGSSQPIADNKTAEGRKANRRVVAVLQSLDTIKDLKAKKKSEEAAAGAEKKPAKKK